MKRIALLLAEGFEEVEAVTPIDFLRRAGIEVDVLGVGAKAVTGSHGITLVADSLITHYRGVPDGVVLPGGMPGAQNLSDSAEAVALIREIDRRGGLVAAICAAPAVVLASLGLLAGRRATCFPGFESRFDDSVEFSEDRVVVDGNRLTSRGAGTAAEFSAAIIAWLEGAEAASEVMARTLQPQQFPGR